MRYNFWIEIKVIGRNANVTVYINKKRHFAAFLKPLKRNAKFVKKTHKLLENS